MFKDTAVVIFSSNNATSDDREAINRYEDCTLKFADSMFMKNSARSLS